MNVWMSLEVPKSCEDCPFCKEVWKDTSGFAMCGADETDYRRVGFECFMYPGKQEDKTEFLRVDNPKCPFIANMKYAKKPATVKQLLLIEKMQHAGCPYCEDKETAQSCFKYIQSHMEEYIERVKKYKEDRNRTSEMLEDMATSQAMEDYEEMGLDQGDFY